MKQILRTPIVAAILVLTAVSAVRSLAGGPGPGKALALQNGSGWWTLLTFPIAPVRTPAELFFVLIAGIWAYSFGPTIEFSRGPRFTLYASFGFAYLVGLAVFALQLISGQPAYLAGPAMFGTGLLLVWGLQHRGMPVSLFGLVNITGLVLAGIAAGLLVLNLGAMGLLFGLAALPALALAWHLATNVRDQKGQDGFTLRKERRERNILDLAHDKQKERLEKDRLRKLFEASLLEDPEKREE